MTDGLDDQVHKVMTLTDHHRHKQVALRGERDREMYIKNSQYHLAGKFGSSQTNQFCQYVCYI